MLNDFLIPIIVIVIVFYGFIKKCDIYDPSFSIFVDTHIEKLKALV